MEQKITTSQDWSGMFRDGAFDNLIINALVLAGSEPAATGWFLRIFFTMENMFLLQPETVNFIRKYADKGNPYALFALGRYQLCTQRDENSTDIAMECFKKAWVKGLYEAEVALSMACDYGDIGLIDRVRAKTLLSDALEHGCEYAAEYQIRKILYGLCGTPANPEQGQKMCDELIAKDMEEYGQDEANPKWYYFKGCAKQIMYGWSHGLEDLRTAADKGLVCAWPDIAIAVSHNDEGSRIDDVAYMAELQKGAAKHNATCAYFLAMSKIDGFDKMSEYAKALAVKQLVIDLEVAYDLGSSEAAEELGNVYYYDDNYEEAFRYYAKGALLSNPSCYEKMFGMIRDHYIDKPQEFQDMLALHGARLGSKKLLGETVMAYTYGRLTEFAAEIEQFYEPVFDADDFSDSISYEDDGEIDDDGRFDAYV